ncbi:SPOR domain-containing protein [Oceanobacillus jeddahense]|uniref:SPOR domain-containing protein n=1 Tax=Oceanobacillus jeddahense TaxID=1462527 RepID=UPI000595A9CA|nr:SPOR domain-containing protein [Oceanobacillus jeddahense]
MTKHKPHIAKDSKGTWTYKVHTSSKGDSAERESAASLENEQEEIDFTTLKPVKSTNKDKLKRNPIWKAILISGLSAIFVGSTIGFFLFRMFVQVDTPTSAENSSQTTPAVSQTEKEETSLDFVSTSLDSLETYIIQAGIFSDQENAGPLIDTLSSLGISTVFFEREEEFYLMAGVASSEDTAQALADSLSDGQAELYVKEWSTQTNEIELTEAESEWITMFQAFFDEQIQQTDLTQPIADEEITALVDKAPDEVNKVDELITSLTEMQGEPAAYQLLSWMKVYDELS